MSMSGRSSCSLVASRKRVYSPRLSRSRGLVSARELGGGREFDYLCVYVLRTLFAGDRHSVVAVLHKVDVAHLV